MTEPLSPATPPVGLQAGRIEARVWRDINGSPFVVLHNAYELEASWLQTSNVLRVRTPPELSLPEPGNLFVEWTAWLKFAAAATALMVNLIGPSAVTIDIDGEELISLARDRDAPPETRTLGTPIAAGWHRVVLVDVGLSDAMIEIAAVDETGQRQPLMPHAVGREPGGEVMNPWPLHGSFTKSA